MNTEYQLLMNIHKVEKAMSMPQRYTVFSQSIIKDIIAQIETDNISLDIKETAYNTLIKYENCLDSNIKENAKIIKIINSLNIPKRKLSYQVNNPIDNKYDALKSIALNRYSVRNYSDKSVDMSSIEQACSLIMIESLPIRQQILTLQQGNQGFKAPLLAALVVDRAAFTQEHEDNAPSLHAGAFLGGFTLALQSLGLSSCILNWHVNSQTNKEVKNLLNLYEEDIACFIFIGYALENKYEAYSYKKKTNDLLRFIK